MIRLRLIATAVAVLTAILGFAPSRASAREPPPRYHLSIDLDLPVLLFGGALASSYFLMSEVSPPACAPLCDPSSINAFDRPFAGRFSRSWQTVSNIATVSTLVLVPAALLLDNRSVAGLRNLLIVGEAVLITAGTEVIVNYAVKRPRPRVYGTDAPLDERNDANAGRSFFSGHAGNCVAATVATTIVLRREGRPKLASAALALGLTGSAIVGLARVEGGAHFPIDVLAGFAVGTAFGFVLPALHETDVALTPIAVAGTF